MSEIWKDIKGKNFDQEYERWFKRRTNAKVLKPALTGGGYEFVCLRKKRKHHNKRIHRLVAEHFVSGFKDGLVVHHIDGNKTNNISTNLEWVSKQKNTQQYYISEGKSLGMVPIKDVPFIIKRINEGEQCQVVAKEYNVRRNDIAVLCKIITLTGEELTIKEKV